MSRADALRDFQNQEYQFTIPEFQKSSGEAERREEERQLKVLCLTRKHKKQVNKKIGRKKRR